MQLVAAAAVIPAKSPPVHYQQASLPSLKLDGPSTGVVLPVCLSLLSQRSCLSAALPEVDLLSNGGGPDQLQLLSPEVLSAKDNALQESPCSLQNSCPTTCHGASRVAGKEPAGSRVEQGADLS